MSTSKLECTGKDSCKMMDTYDDLNFIDIDQIICDGDGACRGFNLDSSGPVECSGENSCNHIESFVANDHEVLCSGKFSCSNQHGWI